MRVCGSAAYRPSIQVIGRTPPPSKYAMPCNTLVKMCCATSGPEGAGYMLPPTVAVEWSKAALLTFARSSEADAPVDLLIQVRQYLR